MGKRLVLIATLVFGCLSVCSLVAMIINGFFGSEERKLPLIISFGGLVLLTYLSSNLLTRLAQGKPQRVKKETLSIPEWISEHLENIVAGLMLVLVVAFIACAAYGLIPDNGWTLLTVPIVLGGAIFFIFLAEKYEGVYARKKRAEREQQVYPATPVTVSTTTFQQPQYKEQPKSHQEGLIFVDHPKREVAKQIMVTLLPLFDGMPLPGLKVAMSMPDTIPDSIGCFASPNIVIRESQLEDEYYKVVNTVKHELIHAWQEYFGYIDEGSYRYFKGHDAFFFIKALEVEVDIDNTLRLYPYCYGAYQEVTSGDLKNMTPQQAWAKLYPGKQRKVRHGNWV